MSANNNNARLTTIPHTLEDYQDRLVHLLERMTRLEERLSALKLDQLPEETESCGSPIKAEESKQKTENKIISLMVQKSKKSTD